ncbi:MAG TPA: M20/M25/M40 family metallo-hydrolase, partial [Candidatus Acidoferrum sp.]|nr:M20/M25/M40 family metallo-hydrolase [Candidatus Acidoferrum sp.]
SRPEHLFAAGGPPINLRFILEGEEEISGTALPRFLRARGKQLKSDAVLIWDGGMDVGDTPAICNALRGILYTELHATGPAIDLHSGTFGGVAPNPILSLARVLGELKDREGRITIPGFYDDVANPTSEELADWRQRDEEFAEAFKKDMGVQVLEGERGFVTRERAGSRPTLDANGIIGGFTGKGEKTVIPARASAKVSMRLVPNQDWRKIFDSLQSYVQTLTTPGVQIRVEMLGSAPPVLCDVSHHAAKALESAYQETFGKRTAFVRAGGSIPVAVDFQETVGAPLVISGVPQADEGAHSPNERMVVDNYHGGIEAVIRFICHLAERP